MRVKLLAGPGELATKARDVVRVLEKLSGQDLLKADVPVNLSKRHVLYAQPNPDGSNKSCGNCPLWRADAERCLIHEASQLVTADMVCGYHFYGQPLADLPAGAELIDPIPAKLTGLETVKGGTSCDSCLWYAAGSCGLLRERVHPKGCCAAWSTEQRLTKAVAKPNEQIKQSPAQFEYAVTRGTVKRGRKEVDRIATIMNQKIAEVLG